MLHLVVGVIEISGASASKGLVEAAVDALLDLAHRRCGLGHSSGAGYANHGVLLERPEPIPEPTRLLRVAFGRQALQPVAGRVAGSSFP